MRELRKRPLRTSAIAAILGLLGSRCSTSNADDASSGAGTGALATEARGIHATACIDDDLVIFAGQGGTCAFAVATSSVQGACKGCRFMLTPRTAAERKTD